MKNDVSEVIGKVNRMVKAAEIIKGSHARVVDYKDGKTFSVALTVSGVRDRDVCEELCSNLNQALVREGNSVLTRVSELLSCVAVQIANNNTQEMEESFE